jgi:hypothetical protein
MKKFKVKLARIITYDNKKESKKDIQTLEATITLGEHVDLGDFMTYQGVANDRSVAYKTQITPWYIQNVTPLDMGGMKHGKGKTKRSIKEINDTTTEVAGIDMPDQKDNADNGFGGEGTSESSIDEQKDTKCG